MNVNALARRHWIPPGALLFAQLAQGVSWILLAYAVAGGVETLNGPAIAWIHTVALGWFTMAALGILVHVVPAFTDVTWIGERIVRGTLAPFALGIAVFVLGWLTDVRVAAGGAAIILAAFLVYYALAAASLSRRSGLEPTERAIARALTITLSVLLVVVILGALMAFGFVSAFFAPLLARVPPIHANLAIYGWLTMLVFGVSARTVRPICGVRSRFPRLHIITGTAMLVGPIVVALGAAVASLAVVTAGAAIIGIGALCYAFDLLDIVRRATVTHRPPQAFLVSAVIWLVVSTLLGAAMLLGKPVAAAFLFVVLIGWIGQMMNAHFFHIGIRLLATVFRGEEDETRPGEVLDARLSWSCFAAAQLAVLLCTAGLIAGSPSITIAGAVLGFAGWMLFLAGVRVAAIALRELPIDLLRL